MSNEGDCRTALATLGLVKGVKLEMLDLNPVKRDIFVYFLHKMG